MKSAKPCPPNRGGGGRGGATRDGASRLARWFCHSAGLILLLTGLAKVLSTLGISRMLDVVDPVFGLKFRHLFMGVGLLELGAAFLILLTDSRLRREFLVAAAMLIMPSFAIGGQEARPFRVQGSLQYIVAPLENAGRQLYTTQHYAFEVTLATTNWSITTKPLNNGPELFHNVLENGTLYAYTLVTSGTATNTGYNGSAVLATKAAPSYGGSMAVFVWLAFCSGEELRQTAPGKFFPLWQVGDSAFAGFPRTKAEWSLISGFPHAPKSLDLHDDGTLRWMVSQGTEQSEKRPAPYDDGFLRWSYRALVLTNFTGLLLPEVARCDLFEPNPAGKQRASTLKVASVILTGTNYSLVATHGSLVPNPIGWTVVDDRRHASRTGSPLALRYTLTNSVWPAADSAILRDLLRQQAAPRQAVSTRRPIIRWSIGFLMLVTTAAVVVFVLSSGKRACRASANPPPPPRA